MALGEKSGDLLNTSYEKLLTSKIWIHDELNEIIGGLGKNNKLFVTKHHISHAASAFYPSPYNNAAILTSLLGSCIILFNRFI